MPNVPFEKPLTQAQIQRRIGPFRFLASLAQQLAGGARRGAVDLIEACAWAVTSGGFACFTIGGTYLESAPGEKRSRILPYYREYLRQIGR